MKALLKQKAGFAGISLAFLLVFVLPSATFISGCASNTTSEYRAYNTLHSVGITANTAVDTWLKYYLLETHRLKAANPTDTRIQTLISQDLEVQKIYGQFSASFNAALTAVQMNPTNLAPAEVSKLCVDLVSVVNVFTGKR